MIKIAVTGNIASGKSAAEKIIEKSGYPVYDLDKISHMLLESKCRDKILKEFGTIERNELANIVFSNKNELLKLENIIYPELKKEISEIFGKNKEKNAVFISGALIIDKGFDKLFDKIIFIDADYNLRLQRLIKRNNYTLEEAKKRIDAQNDKNKYSADFIIENNGNIDELNKKISEVLKSIN